jgi:ribose transport system permease protein
MQPFVVTLCGLLFYRGVARFITGDTTQGFGNSYEGLRYLAIGKFMGIPIPFWIMTALAIVAATFLNRTIWGRYLLALGRNREAARYSGINTDRMIIVAYVICSTLAGIGGILFALDVNSILPSDHGNFFELYAIAAAVLGGCSLRGGEGSILGVVIGAAVMRVLNNSINLLKIPSALEFSIIGVVILGGVIVDELVKRFAAKRRAMREARGD